MTPHDEVDSVLSKIADRNKLLQWWRLLSIGITPDDLPEQFRDYSYEPYILMWLARNIPVKDLMCVDDVTVAQSLTKKLEQDDIEQ